MAIRNFCRRILYIGLYLLIWGVGANVCLMPECLRYIFTMFLLVHSLIHRFSLSIACSVNLRVSFEYPHLVIYVRCPVNSMVCCQELPHCFCRKLETLR
ncbi:hypothetical protein POPTR_007G106850v4 [Populus trichocarpa]|uniref:Uncharacterized protein n=1 Tax=Populus trichocarpa TaxID=3694 RepID=A0A3N7F8S2_POPTR|nr:hypothetical protein POPTR_007G106850v4 [Populus trichocarpa]